MKKVFHILLIVFICISCTKRNDEFKLLKINESYALNITGDVERTDNELILKKKDSYVATTTGYKNFILEMEVKTEPEAIGGISFHEDGFAEKPEGYEILINNNPDSYEWRKTGSLSTIRNFAKCLVNNGEWFSLKIEVVDKNIKVYINDFFTVDYTEPENPFRIKEYEKRRLSYGVFLFANYTDSPIIFRNIKIKKLQPDLIYKIGAQDEQKDEIIRLSQLNFPTIDAHLHLKGGLTKDDVESLTRQYGITYGLSPNCGKNFPVQTDEDIYQWLDTMKNTLCFLAGQAEGREWQDMFSKEAIQEFDYLFTDALTWTDDKGRRMRIWIPEETFVDDKQQFMDMLVDRACTIISTEPIQIYVNPTFIPPSLQPEYDNLWTEERMDKIIDVCVANNIAIEIGCRYRIPSQKFIQRAKSKGAKFTIGTNNEGIGDVGKIEYAVEMIHACKLTREDMWIPTGKIR